MHLVLFGRMWGGEAGSTAHTMNLYVRKHVEEGGGGVYNDKKDNLDDEVWEGGREGGPTIGCMQFTNNTQTKTRERKEGLKAQWRGIAGRDPSNNWKIKMF